MLARSIELFEDAVRGATAALSLSDLAQASLPRLKESLGLSYALLYERGLHGEFRSYLPRGEHDHMREYGPWAEGDPLREPLRKEKVRGVRALSEMIDPALYRRSAAYNEFFMPRELDERLAVPLLDKSYGAPGDVVLVLCKGRNQKPFGPGDRRALEYVLPSFCAAARRHERWERELGVWQSMFELERAPPFLAFDCEARLISAAPAAMELLGGEALPAPIISAARKLGALVLGKKEWAPFSVEMRSTLGGRLTAELCIAHLNRTHEPFVAVRLRSAKMGLAHLRAFAGRWRLTPAEAAVLEALGDGLSNLQIAKRLFISRETARTHLAHMFRKLRVRSRIQALIRFQRGD